jgi:RNA polymerase sigma-70 factor (ECF subfamily)
MARVEQAPAGVERAEVLERLYREQGGRMWRSVLAFAGDPEVASDAVAEAFAQALRRGEAIRDPERWLWRSVFRLAAGELDRRRRGPAVARPPTYEMEEPAVELVAALAALSPKQRAAVVLHHAAGYPLREVAAILGSTTGAVKVHLLRGRRRLRVLLEDVDAQP